MTDNKIATIDRNQSILATYSNEQISVIKQHVAKNATNDELVYFLQVCKSQNLDPFAKQIYFVKRKMKVNDAWVDQMSIQTGIDGYRAIAEQTGKLAGIDDAIYDDGANEQTGIAGKPRKATVTVWKLVKGVKVGFTASARWAEYYPGDKQGFMWNKMPFLMLGKVAEALALRKAFPKNLGAIYTNEEMQATESEYVEAVVTNADALKPAEMTTAAPTQINDEQMAIINSELARTGKKLEDLLKHLNRVALSDLTYKEALTWIKSLMAQPSKVEANKVNAAEPVYTAPIEGEIVHDEVETIEEMPEPELTPAMKRMKEAKEAARLKAEKPVPIPPDVCETINFYDTLPENEWPAGMKELKHDCNNGSFKGKEAYPGLFN